MARALRVIHAAVAVVGVSSLGYVWLCALTGRRDRLLATALAALSVQGVAIAIGRGNCPLGPVQRRFGDAVPFFELVLPRSVAKMAFPVLGFLTVGGVTVLALRTLRRDSQRPAWG